MSGIEINSYSLNIQILQFYILHCYRSCFHRPLLTAYCTFSAVYSLNPTTNHAILLCKGCIRATHVRKTTQEHDPVRISRVNCSYNFRKVKENQAEKRGKAIELNERIREKRNPCVRWLAAYWICWRCVEQMIAQLPPWKNLAGNGSIRLFLRFLLVSFASRPTEGCRTKKVYGLQSAAGERATRERRRDYNRLSNLAQPLFSFDRPLFHSNHARTRTFYVTGLW